LTPACCSSSSERGLAHFAQLGEARFGKTEIAAEPIQRIVGDEGRHDEPAAGRDLRRSRRVDQIGVLDRADPVVDGAANRFRCIGMGQDIGMPRPRLLDDGAHLVIAVLQVPDRVVGRGDPARRHDLDLGRALAQLVARRAAAFVHAVGDSREARAILTAGAADDRASSRPQIAMAAGLAQRLPGRKQPRPADEPLRHRLGESAIGAAGVPHAGEPAREHALEHPTRLEGNQRQRLLGQPRQGGVDSDNVNMRIDQSGHQGLPGEVDRLGIRSGYRPIRDFLDPITVDQDVMAFATLAASAVEQRAVGEDDSRHCNDPSGASR
jgi:hypothetical protein